MDILRTHGGVTCRLYRSATLQKGKNQAVLRNIVKRDDRIGLECAMSS